VDELLQIAELASLPLHAVLALAVWTLWRDNQKLRLEVQQSNKDFIDYLKERATGGDAAAQKVVNGRGTS